VVAIFSGLLREGSPLRIFGDGRQTRDYVYVIDVVAALLAADAALAERGTAVEGPYNVGTGVEVDVNDLAERLGRVAGGGTEIEYMPERPGEVNRVAIDPAAAGRDLGWRSATDLGDGLRRTYEGLERG
jgi:nucleoside-diphosphate-sugar epimerase